MCIYQNRLVRAHTIAIDIVVRAHTVHVPFRSVLYVHIPFLSLLSLYMVHAYTIELYSITMHVVHASMLATHTRTYNQTFQVNFSHEYTLKIERKKQIDKKETNKQQKQKEKNTNNDDISFSWNLMSNFII